MEHEQQNPVCHSYLLYMQAHQNTLKDLCQPCSVFQTKEGIPGFGETKEEKTNKPSAELTALCSLRLALIQVISR